jgi:hypothetical protein
MVRAEHTPSTPTLPLAFCHPSPVPRPRALAALLYLSLIACPASPPAPAPSSPASSPPPSITPAASAPAPPSADPPAASASSAAPALDPAPILFPDAATTVPEAAACLPLPDPRARARCLFTARYAADPIAAQLAVDLFETTGTVAGVQVEQDMEGGFRGKLHLVPEVAMGRYRRHLEWVAAALHDFDAFFAELVAPAPVRYRFRPLAFRFFRSVGRTTPSAYAEGWSVSYNVSGSLHRSADAVRETLFHEIFHLNDAARDDWSKRRLLPTFDAVVARCGTRVACLRPYAPGDTMVRGGTYYAFQPDNGEPVHEYGAELALRWYREQRAVQRGERLAQAPFKCGPEENRRAWEAIVAELFGGADAVPACP